SRRATIARDLFLTDFRYATQSAEQVSERFAREIVADDLLEAAARALVAGAAPTGTGLARPAAGEPGTGSEGRLGFDEANLTVKQHSHLRELLGCDWELVACAGIVERLRTVKDAHELARIRGAAELADRALMSVLEEGIVHRSELEVAIEIELRIRRLG